MARSRRGNRTQAAKLPSPDELLEIIHDAGGHVSARDLARDLGLRGGDKAELKRRLRSVKSGSGKRSPSMTMCEVIEQDEDGELWGESAAYPGTAILLVPDKLTKVSPKTGDRILTRMEWLDDGSLIGHIFRILPQSPRNIVGVIEQSKSGWWLKPSHKDAKREFRVENPPTEISAGDLVRAELTPNRPLASPKVTIVERFGRFDEPSAVSMSVAAELGLPTGFSQIVLDQANAARPVMLGQRTDLRDIPLITIDGEDARDFDDAVFAQLDQSPANPGGYQAIVAIADVAHYVRPGTALDDEAFKRGNSVYFPDRVLPMLPEALSNGLCSLRPNEDRACLSCHMQVSADGKLLKWRFKRSLMRSKARLTYEQVQSIHDIGSGGPNGADLKSEVELLFGLFESLVNARRKRGTIELEIPERRVEFSDDGTIRAIVPRTRLASHMLIEEMMIAANVAAAKTLARRNLPCIYRVHDRPSAIKLEALVQHLTELGLSSSKNAKSQHDFNRLLASIDDVQMREQVAGLVLRAQSQAIYSTDNVGHFGLNLAQYGHFTSPIRRYSDLLLHRLLISHLNLAEAESGQIIDEDRLEKSCVQVSATERKAVEAERKAMSRYIAIFMASHEGARFAGRITSVQRFGLFIALDGTGAEGLVPVSTLGDERFTYDEKAQLLIGDRTRNAFGIGDLVEATLVEADTVKGMLLFGLDNHQPSVTTEQSAKKMRRSGSRPRSFKRR